MRFTLSAMLRGWVAQPLLALILQGTEPWNCKNFSIFAISTEVLGKLKWWVKRWVWFPESAFCWKRKSLLVIRQDKQVHCQAESRKNYNQFCQFYLSFQCIWSCEHVSFIVSGSSKAIECRFIPRITCELGDVLLIATISISETLILWASNFIPYFSYLRQTPGWEA